MRWRTRTGRAWSTGTSSPPTCWSRADGQIKVTDFGIARIEASNFTQRGDMLGTPSYMSPEQYMGEATDGRSDIFATGVILYELLTGERPFTGDSSGQIMKKILHETPVNPSELNPQVPPQVDWVLQKALAKDVEDRFDNAREFQVALYNAIPDARARRGGGGSAGFPIPAR